MLVLGAALQLASSASADATWSLLEGRWTGVGTIRLDGGGSEQLKCVAIYRAQGDGHVAQRLTCVGSSYRIEGSADLVFEGNRVSGTWTERSYAVGGGLAGSANDGKLHLDIDGPTFSGTVAIEVERCRQSISVDLANTIISGLSAGLRRC